MINHCEKNRINRNSSYAGTSKIFIRLHPRAILGISFLWFDVNSGWDGKKSKKKPLGEQFVLEFLFPRVCNGRIGNQSERKVRIRHWHERSIPWICFSVIRTNWDLMRGKATCKNRRPFSTHTHRHRRDRFFFRLSWTWHLLHLKISILNLLNPIKTRVVEIALDFNFTEEAFFTPITVLFILYR